MGRGASTRLEAAAGTYVVQARMDWLRSPPLTLTLDAQSSVTLTAALTEQSMTFTGAFIRPGTALDPRAG
ncbi:hypothetical protein M1L60_13945 [Actinoplanes sp. TRM 88003]|uniref:Uncharacterized protein n=1 Tax=Paractinoplanes aksuensis TaxID=2939490 RepID=A0ABT1DLL1_9ACTN|nr:hypothetical protein [Actinoplanes aksuensis]MCO8271694.1 hypothetical protein [Actinoplanes aksuensis]